MLRTQAPILVTLSKGGKGHVEEEGVCLLFCSALGACTLWAGRVDKSSRGGQFQGMSLPEALQ